ncbi:MAG TPA: DoxX family protein [Longimicrobiaceae bacterium]|nr:DoxX family protein [Longimicrobiaceae bacterium]
MNPFFMHRFEEATLALLRVMAGLLFMQHGAQKLFGALGGFGGQPGATAPLMSQMGLAGVLEFFGGLLVAFGLFTRPVAFVLAGQMAVAYFTAHLPQGFWPILNGGELAALFCCVFLYFSARGGGRYSLDGMIGRGRPDEARDRAV